MTARLFLLVLGIVGSAFAQFGMGPTAVSHELRIHLSFANEGNCEVGTKIALMNSYSSSIIAENPADRSCVVEFTNVVPGSYRLAISGNGFATVETSEIVVSSPDTETLDITVNRAGAEKSPGARSSSVAVADLRIPKRALEKFDKASQEMRKQNWRSAIDLLQKAIEIYPQYAEAYNSLGVSYARIGEREREAEALRKAVSINDRCVGAYVNLARLDIAANDFADAELKLEKAISLDPADLVAKVLLAHAEFMDHRLDEAIAHCRQVHAKATGPHSFAHWIAAFAFEQKNQLAAAQTEFQTYLIETPNGDRSNDARKEIANIASFLSLAGNNKNAP